MAEEKAPSPPVLPPANGSLDALARVLVTVVDALSTWQRVLAFLVVVLMVFAGFVLFQVREQIGPALTVLSTKPEYRLANRSRLDQAAVALLSDLHATAVIIWETDLGHNRRTVRAVAGTPELLPTLTPLLPAGKSFPIFVRLRHPEVNLGVIATLMGEVGCGPAVLGPAVLEAWGVSLGPLMEGVKWTCMVSIPSSADAFVGLVTVGFAEPLTEVQEQLAESALRARADTLVVK
jgi:hypothetical protein